MPKPQLFAGSPGSYTAHFGLTGGECRARDRALADGAWVRVASLAAKDHKVKPADVKLLWSHEFEKPYEDGSIGEVSVRYNAHNEAIYGLYSDGRIELWAD